MKNVLNQSFFKGYSDLVTRPQWDWKERVCWSLIPNALPRILMPMTILMLMRVFVRLFTLEFYNDLSTWIIPASDTLRVTSSNKMTGNGVCIGSRQSLILSSIVPSALTDSQGKVRLLASPFVKFTVTSSDAIAMQVVSFRKWWGVNLSFLSSEKEVRIEQYNLLPIKKWHWIWNYIGRY